MRLFWAVLLLAAACLGSSEAWAKDRLIILAGQSNMMGRGKTNLLPAAYKKTPSNVHFFYQGRPRQLAQFAFFGPEVSFAHEVARAFPHDRIILVKQAATGSLIQQWQPGGSLYKSLLRQVSFATRDYPEADIEAVVWMQGESDARGNPQNAQQYGSRLSKLIQSLRSDLHAPNSLFVLGQINPEHPAFTMTDIVRRQQLQIDRQLPRTETVSTTGLGKLFDHIHYDANGLMQLGKRFANAYIQYAGR